MVESIKVWMKQQKAKSSPAVKIAAGTIVAALLALPIVGTSTYSHANDPLSAGDNLVIKDAVGVYITPRGQNYFKNNLEDLLFRNGIALTEGQFDKFVYTAPKALTLDDLPPQYRPYRKSLEEVRDSLHRWLMNSTIHDPLFRVTVLGTEYALKFKTLGVTIDPKAAEHYGIKHGIVVVAHVAIPKLNISVPKVRVQDLHNEFLNKKLGLTDFWAEIKDNSTPLTLEMPVHIDIVDGKVTLNALSFKTNLDVVTTRFGFSKLLLPDVTIRINDKVMTLDPDEVKADIMRNQGGLMKMLKTYLKEYAANNLTTLVNQEASKVLQKGLDEVTEFDPPGGPTPTKPEDRFKLRVSPQEVHYTNQTLFLGVNGEVIDPKAHRDTPFTPVKPASNKPQLGSVSANSYDLALVLNQNLINRVVQMSYQRGYFDQVKLADGSFVKVITTPVFQFDQEVSRDHAKLHVKVEQTIPCGYERIALKEHVRLEFDIQVRLKSSGGVPKLILEKVDISTVKVDTSSFSALARNLPPLRALVFSKINKMLADANTGYARSEEVLGVLPLPSILGLPFTVKELHSDISGSIILYLEYKLK
ncbi:MAG: hypothetical protein H7222_02785 [Methylotenera sp.]|nr:hypothetical protein [Oligoflexia bacterium]